MRLFICAFFALSLGIASVSYAAGNGPCKQIKAACEGAGFVKGDAKAGFGLWVDCIRPIMKGSAQPSKATKALPQVDPQLVTACKAKHPKWGEGGK